MAVECLRGNTRFVNNTPLDRAAIDAWCRLEQFDSYFGPFILRGTDVIVVRSWESSVTCPSVTIALDMLRESKRDGRVYLAVSAVGDTLLVDDKPVAGHVIHA